MVFQVWAFEGERYQLSLYVVEDPLEGEPTVQVMRTEYYAVTVDTLIRLMTEAGFDSVERLDGSFYQPVIVGTRPHFAYLDNVQGL